MNSSTFFHPFLAVVSVLLALTVSACSSKPGEVYVGQWKSTASNDASVITIARNDDNFRVDLEGNSDPADDVIFHLDNGSLVFDRQVGQSHGGIVANYIESSGLLTLEMTGAARAMVQLSDQPTKESFKRL